MKLTDKAIATNKKICIFGPPKSGKTKLFGTLAAEKKLLYFDLENSYSVLLQLPLAQQENIEIISIPDTKSYPIAIETMLKVITGKRVAICHAHGKVHCPLCNPTALKDKVYSDDLNTTVCLDELSADTVVGIDSLTQLANSAMSFLTKNESDTYKPEWTDYRNQGALMDKILSSIQQAKYSVVCMTHEAEVDMEDGKKKLVPVAGTTNFSRNTSKYFDDVVYVEVLNKKHTLGNSTTYKNNVLTGSRSSKVLDGKVDVSLLELFKP